MTNELSMSTELLQELGKGIHALGGYRSLAVLTGGLVPLMYRFLPQFTATVDMQAVRTFDIDWTVPNILPSKGISLHDQLVDAGFLMLLQGNRPIPVLRYQLANYGPMPAPIYLEFLTPRVGSTEIRGKEQNVREVQSGLLAQTLPYLELLLHSPIAFDVSVISELQLKPGTQILVPEPMAFVLQKVLARSGRRAQKRSGDQAHIFDVVLLARHEWGKMAEELQGLQACGAFPDRWLKRARQILCELYKEERGIGPAEVARVFSGTDGHKTISEPIVRRVMCSFLDTIGW
jgi:hypothetical protein